MAKSTKIMKGTGQSQKTTGYIVPTPNGGAIVVEGGEGKDGYLGRTERPTSKKK